MQAHKLHLPLHHQRRSSSSSSPADSSSLVVSSLLFEPSSRSLALMLSDSSVLLYPPLPSPLPLPTPAFPPPTTIPPISTSACFLRLQPAPHSDLGRVLFLSAAPQGASVLLRAWILSRGEGFFAPARLCFKRDRLQLGVVLDLRHGFSVALAAAVNVFVLHSPAAGRIWVCGARLLGEVGDGDPAVELMKCAVIECASPVFSVQVSLGSLLLGEVGGVRVFPLRPLVKGRAGSRKDPRRRRHEERNQKLRGSEPTGFGFREKKLPNGPVADVIAGKDATSYAPCESTGRFCNDKGIRLVDGEVNIASNSNCRGQADTERACAKLRTVKLKQNSGDLSSYFVAIDSPQKISLSSVPPVKAISIHAVSHKRFLILDSIGDLHLLNLCNTIMASETSVNTLESSKDAYTIRLDYTMKVQMLAVLPDLSMRSQIIWISDAFHSVHIIPLADVENDKDNSEEKPLEVSASRAIFMSERIQDIAPLTAHAVMILGQGNRSTRRRYRIYRSTGPETRACEEWFLPDSAGHLKNGSSRDVAMSSFKVLMIFQACMLLLQAIGFLHIVGLEDSSLLDVV